MPERIFNVLFLCTGNSARSVMAEAILNRVGAAKFRAHSAGSRPKGAVNPHTLRLLQDKGYDTAGLRSKSWDEFAGGEAPEFDCIITVCDDAAGETCPLWPGKPTMAHWGIPDPAAATGTPAEIARAFHEAYRLVERRIAALAALPVVTLDPPTLQGRLREIGQMEGATAKARS
jgi:arsenate reductase (thioredoxin)